MPKENNLQRQGTYNLTDKAKDDLRDIWVYIGENNQFAADKRMFPFKKYHIYYFPIDEGVEIYRVLHGSRDIEGEFESFFEGLKE